MKVKFCPKCEDADIVMLAGGEIGMWECKKCGFRGAVFPEKEIVVNKPTKKNNKK